MNGTDELMRRCFELAAEAAANGSSAFGALLAREGEILLEAANTVGETGDATGHAELNLVSRATRRLPPEVLERATLYTSTEPCAMCAGAIVWAGLRRVVYGCSAVGAAALLGHGFVIGCRQVLAAAPFPIQVVGPVAEEDGLAQHSRLRR